MSKVLETKGQQVTNTAAEFESYDRIVTFDQPAHETESVSLILNGGTLDLTDELAIAGGGTRSASVSVLSGSVTTGAGNDYLSVDSTRFGDISLNGGAGNDYLVALSSGSSGSSGRVTLDGGAGDDGLQGDGATLYGGDGNDRVSGNGRLYGGNGNDSLFLQGGSSSSLDNILDGGDGDDDISTNGERFSAIVGGAGNDTISASITSYGDNTSIDAGAGNDRIYVSNFGYSYSDATTTLNGGDGFDTLRVSGNLAGMSISGVEVLETQRETITGNAEQFEAFDQIVTYGEPIYQGDPDYRAESVSLRLSNGGNLNLTDELAITSAAARSATVYASSAGNSITTSFGNDTLIGGMGNDTLTGARGNDSLEGGEGTDVAVFAAVYAAGMIQSTGSNNFTVTTAEGIDTLSNIELARFANGTYSFASGVFTSSQPLMTLQTEGQHVTRTVAEFEAFDRIVTVDDPAHLNETVSLILSDKGALNLADELEGLRGADVQASALGNIITTGSRNDILRSGAGNDTLIGGAGDDIYVVNGAKDVVTEQAGQGSDIVQTALSSYTLGANLENLTYTGATAFTGTGNDEDNIIRGGTGSNTLKGGAGADALYGGTGADKLDGGLGVDTLHGGAGNDTYTVDDSFDVIDETSSAGGDAGGVDHVNSSATSFTLGAYVENLTLIGSADIDGTGNELANKITGNSGNNILSGGGGVDALMGGAGNDVLYGGADNDKLDGGTGADILIGGTGNDTYSVDASNVGSDENGIFHLETGDDIIEEAGEGVDSVTSSADHWLSDNVENLTLIGSALDGYGNDGANQITGNANNNWLQAGGGNDVLSGMAGADILFGEEGNDRLDGGLGADFMGGGSGNDSYVVDDVGDYVEETDGVTGADTGGLDSVTLNTDTYLATGGSTFTLSTFVENLTLTGSANVDARGNDSANKITGNSGGNMLSGGGGNDVLTGNAGIDDLDGGAGDDTLLGGTEDDILSGGAGIDKLDGGAGADQMRGGEGSDTYTVDNAGDTVIEEIAGAQGGVDLINSSVAFELGMNVENLILTGSASIRGTGNDLANKITGNTGNNTLAGQGGDDILSGGVGNDVLIGGDGKDTLTGGGGADIFVFGPADAMSIDKVTDFSAPSGDKLQFQSDDFGLSVGRGLNTDGTLATGYFELVSGKATVGTQGHGQFLFNTTSKTLFWDADGNVSGQTSQASVAIASFTVSISASDFHFIV